MEIKRMTDWNEGGVKIEVKVRKWKENFKI